MKEFWMCFGFTMLGMVVGYVLCLEQLKNEIDNKKIEIRKAKMKGNTNSAQEFTSNLDGEKQVERKRLINLKRKNKV